MRQGDPMQAQKEINKAIGIEKNQANLISQYNAENAEN